MLRDSVKIKACSRNIEYEDGIDNHYFMLMAVGMPESEAYKIYKEEQNGKTCRTKSNACSVDME